MDTEEFIKQTIELPVIRDIYFGDLHCWSIILNRNLVKIPENEMVFNVDRLNKIHKKVTVELRVTTCYYILKFRRYL